MDDSRLDPLQASQLQTRQVNGQFSGNLSETQWVWASNLLGLFGLLAIASGYAWCEAHRNGNLSRIVRGISLPPTAHFLDATISHSQNRTQQNETTSIPSAAETANETDFSDRGDAVRGEKIFFEKPEAMCRNCHRVNGKGGDVGPDLSRIGAQRTREQLRESLLNPDAIIAEGFTTVLIQTVDGELAFGIVREDCPEHMRIVDVQAKEHIISTDDIVDRRPGRSAMPANVKDNLEPNEFRDLVEYLVNLKGQ